MKTLTQTLIAVLFLVNICFPLREASANSTSYKLSVSNLNYTSGNSLEFDIYLLNTSENEFNYLAGQYFFEFNPKIANGGTLTYTIVSSDLPEALRPRNASIFENQLRLAGNSITSKDNLPIVPSKQPGLLIARMKLETSAKIINEVPLDLRWSENNLKTKIVTYVNHKDIEITKEENHSMELDNSKSGITQSNPELPKEYSLAQNYPNPFNPETKISYELPASNYVTMKIYDITGKEVKTLVNQLQNAGSYEVRFNASSLSSGIYFYKIQSGNFSKVMRMMLIK